MDDTRGSGVLSSSCDMLEMSVVRGVCGVCDMCLARGGVGVVGCERIWFGIYQFWRNLGKVGSVFWLGEWVGSLGPGVGGGWYYVWVCCESGSIMLMSGSGTCVLC